MGKRTKWLKEWEDAVLQLNKEHGNNYALIKAILKARYDVDIPVFGVRDKINSLQRGKSLCKYFASYENIPDIVKPFVTHNEKNPNYKYYITKTKYDWLMHGMKLEKSQTHFIYWDDNLKNTDISNLQPITRSIFRCYILARIGLPKGDVELNKSVYQRIIIEQSLKRRK